MRINAAIARRELAESLSSRWGLAMQWAPAIGLSALILLRWPDAGEADVAGVQAESLFRVLSYAILALLLLMSPVIPAMSIVREKRRGALALLLNSPLTPSAIYGNKFAAAAGYTALPLALSLPAAASCYVMGGVDLVGDVALLYVVLALAAMQVAAIGLWVSSAAASLDSALRWTYAAVLAVCVLSVAPKLFLAGRPASVWTTSADWLACLSPISAVQAVAGGGGFFGGSFSAGSTVWKYSAAVAAMAALLAWRTIGQLRPTVFDRPRAVSVSREPASRLRRRLRAVLFLIDPERVARPIGDWINPVLVKEFRTRQFGRSQWLVRLVAVCSLLSLLMTYAASSGAVALGVERVGSVLVLLQAALILTITPSLASGLISVERESGGWRAARNTPLGAGRILTGKLLSVCFTVTLILLATLPGYAVMMVIQPVLQQQVTQVLVCLVLTAIAAVCLSASISSFFARTTAATVAAYGALAVLCGGSFLVWLARDAPFGHSVVETALQTNPIAAALQILEAPGFAAYRLVPSAWIAAGLLSVVSLAALWARTVQLLRPE